MKFSKLKIQLVPIIVLVIGIFIANGAAGQGMGMGMGPPPVEKTAEESAAYDLTGYWVAVITEDWRWRMAIPPHGDYESVPLNDAGTEMADTWDPVDIESCKPYGAASVMRMPLRLHITWEDENTLRIDTDHGMQTRLLHFDDSTWSGGELQWQGYSNAEWERPRTRRRPGRQAAQTQQATHLKVVTTHMRAGYLRTNGVPYSEDTLLTEYFDRHSDYDEDWITITTIVNDPKYLNEEFITSSSFKKLANDRDWNPTPCGTS